VVRLALFTLVRIANRVADARLPGGQKKSQRELHPAVARHTRVPMHDIDELPRRKLRLALRANDGRRLPLASLWPAETGAQPQRPSLVPASIRLETATRNRPHRSPLLLDGLLGRDWSWSLILG
jgi:hypothetical protein